MGFGGVATGADVATSGGAERGDRIFEGSEPGFLILDSDLTGNAGRADFTTGVAVTSPLVVPGVLFVLGWLRSRLRIGRSPKFA